MSSSRGKSPARASAPAHAHAPVHDARPIDVSSYCTRYNAGYNFGWRQGASGNVYYTNFMGDFGVGYAHGYRNGEDEQYAKNQRVKSNTVAKFHEFALDVIRNVNWLVIIWMSLLTVLFGYAMVWLCGVGIISIGIVGVPAFATVIAVLFEFDESYHRVVKKW